MFLPNLFSTRPKIIFSFLIYFLQKTEEKRKRKTQSWVFRTLFSNPVTLGVAALHDDDGSGDYKSSLGKLGEERRSWLFLVALQMTRSITHSISGCCTFAGRFLGVERFWRICIFAAIHYINVRWNCENGTKGIL